MGQGVGGQSELSQTQRPTNTFAPAHTYTKGAMWNTVVVTLKTNVFFFSFKNAADVLLGDYETSCNL